MPVAGFVRIKWCPESDLNQRPTAYEAVALPLSYRGADEAETVVQGSRTLHPRSGAVNGGHRAHGRGAGMVRARGARPRRRHGQRRHEPLAGGKPRRRCPAGRAPAQAVEAAAMQAERRPARALGAAGIADIGLVEAAPPRRAREPGARRAVVVALGLLELGHEAADSRRRRRRAVARRGARRLEVTARLTPEPRLQPP